MTMNPTIAIHMTLAIGALLVGPVALTLRKGSPGHRLAGYGWVTLMLGTALTSLLIRDFRLPNLGGYTPIHILTVASLAGISLGIWHVRHGRIRQHRRSMWLTYLSGCVGAGLFTLLPSRYLGNLLWHQTLGLV